MRPIGYLFLSVAAVGCYPIHKTLQPSAEVTVLDQEGNAIRDVEVYLVANAYRYGFEKSRHMVRNNLKSVASFPKIKEWRTEVLMIHGAEVYFWNWCVKKDSYATQFTNYGSGSEFESNKTFQLSKGKSENCPERFR